MAPKALDIIAVPRPDGNPADIQPKFDKLYESTLFLDLLEIKNKLKPNLPKLEIKKIIVKKKKEPEQNIITDLSISSKTPDNTLFSNDEDISELTKDYTIPEELVNEEIHQINNQQINNQPPIENIPQENIPQENIEQDVIEEIVIENNTMDPLEEKYYWVNQFKVLKRHNKDREDIPIYNIHDDVEEMKSRYKEIKSEIDLTNNVSRYQFILKVTFIITELICIKIFGMEMNGFALTQLKQMEAYESMLIELGEQSSGNWITELPVEARLFGTIMMNALIFWGAKNFPGFEMLMTLITGVKNFKSPNTTEEKKHKMGGPSVKAKDIKNE